MLNVNLSKEPYESQLSYNEVLLLSFVHKLFAGFFSFGVFKCGVFPACENRWFTRHLSRVNTTEYRLTAIFAPATVLIMLYDFDNSQAA